MISVFLSRELGTGFVLNEVPEHRGLTLELARLIAWAHPIEDIAFFLVRLGELH
jgi:hypothetical protein